MHGLKFLGAHSHAGLNNLTPADVYFGHGQAVLLEWEKIKRRTIDLRRSHHAKPLPRLTTQTGQNTRS